MDHSVTKKSIGDDMQGNGDWRGRRVLLDGGDHRIDFERLGNRDATLGAEVVVPQTAKVGAE